MIESLPSELLEQIEVEAAMNGNLEAETLVRDELNRRALGSLAVDFTSYADIPEFKMGDE